MKPIQGLHHITAVASDPQRNLEFYTSVLGQRLVKTTVNFDDPTTYHLYYADLIGTPGSVLTFFPWPHMRRGRVGNGETAAFAYAIPKQSAEFWKQRLTDLGITTLRTEERFGDTVLIFDDPDGMTVELVATDEHDPLESWEDGPIPFEHELRGFYSVTLWLGELEPTASLLKDEMGYHAAGQEKNRYRFRADADGHGTVVDIVHRPGETRGGFGSGSIHHIAFRTLDDEEQLQYRDRLISAGQHVTPVQDRQYFHSIYFREPGGVLFEIATDAPGFLIDEPLEKLGQKLRLPTWYESRRSEIESALPPLNRESIAG